MVEIRGPVTGVASACEPVLRSLAQWFGMEAPLLQYAANTERLPTFIAESGLEVVGFISLEQHSLAAWEVNCVAVTQALRGKGIGRRLHLAAEAWLLGRGARLLQVKTLADTHPSPEYAQTRAFYQAMGYLPLEVFPTLWADHLPVLQLVKVLEPRG